MNDETKAALKAIERSHLRDDPDWQVVRAYIDEMEARSSEWVTAQRVFMKAEAECDALRRELRMARVLGLPR